MTVLEGHGGSGCSSGSSHTKEIVVVNSRIASVAVVVEVCAIEVPNILVTGRTGAEGSASGLCSMVFANQVRLC